MTDITELAQSLKTAAIDAKELAIIARYSKGRAAAEKFYALANPNNVLALVDALEKAQQKIDELENDEVRQRLANAEHQLYMAELAKHNLKASRKAQFRKRRAAEKRIAELEEAEQKLCAANVTLDARAELAERHLAELESRSITVKLPKLKMLEDYLAEVAIEERKQILVGVKLEFHRACVAAGIKVEAE